MCSVVYLGDYKIYTTLFENLITLSIKDILYYRIGSTKNAFSKKIVRYA